MPGREICILAGGLSARMGRDKARLRLGGKTFLGHVRATAKKTGWPVRIIRRDLVARCGPLGGIYTALQTSRADSVLFLACDMPCVSLDLMEKISKLQKGKTAAVFTGNVAGGKAGFPFILRRDLLAIVEEQLAQRNYSLQSLAVRCRAEIFTVRSRDSSLLNVNTPAQWKAAQNLLRMLQDTP